MNSFNLAVSALSIIFALINLFQCVSTQTSSAYTLNIGVYYESLCPDSRNFINSQLSKVFTKYQQYTNVTLVPYGKANFTWNENKNEWYFQCQHGPNECYGNMLHNCLIHKYPKFNEHFQFINCSMSDIRGNVLDVATRCAQEYSIEIDDLIKCANSSLGNQLLYGSGLLTESLQPQRNYVPWIVVNSQHTSDMQTQAESDLVRYICKEYKGSDLPSECKAYLNHSSYLRAGLGIFLIPLIISFIFF